MIKRSSSVQVSEIVKKLEKCSVPEAREGMARFGIKTKLALGVPVPVLRKMAKELGKNHELALQLWSTKIHEARILASMVGEPELIAEQQMESWVREFNSWDLCDQCCMNLFEKTKFAYKKAVEWSSRKEEFVKRAGFVMMARLAVSDKMAGGEEFLKFLLIIKREAGDERNFVKKAVNWALRQVGKRSLNLNRAAIEIAKEIQKMDSKSAKWIASDAIRELTSKRTQRRLRA